MSITNSRSSLRLTSIESVMPSNYLILCHPLLLLPSIFPSIRVFSNELVLCIRWPNIGASASAITPSNDYSGLISFNIDWFDLLAVQGSLKSLLLITTILKHQFFSTQPSLMVQLSDLYMTTGKTIRSDQISRSVVSNSLLPHESQHTRPPCPSPTPGVHSDSCPSSQ